MLKQLLHTIIYLIASLFLQVNAFAQSAIDNFSYSEKTEAIRLAKAGDAEALYKLGLSHLQGVNAVQNHNVAERFFFYAAENGHAEATQFLRQTQHSYEASSPVKSTVLKLPAIKPTLVKAVDVKPAPIKPVQPKPKKRPMPQAEAVKTMTPKIADAGETIRTKPPVIETTSKTPPSLEVNKPLDAQAIKVASTSDGTSLDTSDAQPIKSKSKWRYFLYLLYFIGILLIAFLIYSLLSGYLKTKKLLPKGFNRRTYLKLNPDVKSAGHNAAAHYLHHGEREGRPYK